MAQAGGPVGLLPGQRPGSAAAARRRRPDVADRLLHRRAGPAAAPGGWGDLARVAAGCRMSPPDFIIAGAMRSGTTALADALACHPGVFMTEPKEPSYFTYRHGGESFSGPGDQW